MESGFWHLVIFSAEMAALSTILIIPLGLFCAWLLSHYEWRGKAILETVIALPIVLPPVATGLLLLKFFGRNGPVGGFLERLGLEVVFTWKAVVIAMAVMSFPLLVRSLRTAFEEINPRLEQVAQTLGARPWRIFWTITLPLAWRGFVAGLLLAFARALGEFGATIMVAGNIPGETQTLSLAIFQAIQLGKDDRAYAFAGVSAVLAFGALLISEHLTRKKRGVG
jgi:molybdate transport system permease protein